MIITIDKTELDIYEKACAELDILHTIYTHESNPSMALIDIENLTDKIAFQLGRMVQMNWHEKMVKTYKGE